MTELVIGRVKTSERNALGGGGLGDCGTSGLPVRNRRRLKNYDTKDAIPC
jgi:hypothetical protein